MSPAPPIPVREAARDGSAPQRACPVCATALTSSRARYCSRACQQRAFRLRHAAVPPDTTALTADLRRRGTLAAHTIYECPDCETRLLGRQRCDDCHRFCRALGLGGRCPDCDTPILLVELLDGEVPPSPTAWPVACRVHCVTTLGLPVAESFVAICWLIAPGD
jgi:hypothetical protein